MMKLKLDQLMFFGILMQIISTQGVLTYLFFNIFGFWELKSAIHPISFALVVLVFLAKAINRIKITQTDLLFVLYSIISILILIINVDTLSSFYYAFREIFMVFILIFIYNQTRISLDKVDIILKILHVFVILNLVFVFFTYYLGPDNFMRMLIGRYQWGVDDIYKFQISVFMGRFWRSPGIVGSSGAMAYFALFTYILMDGKKKYRFKKILAFLLLFLTFTRSALLAFFIYIFLNFILRKANISKIIMIGKYLVPIICLLLIVLNQFDVLSLKSIWMRFDVWFNRINIDYNILFGGAIGEVGLAVKESADGAEAILDSYWLMLLLSTGLVGVFVWLLFFIEKSKKSIKLISTITGVIIAGFFITLTQAIPFIVMLPLLYLKTDNFESI